MVVVAKHCQNVDGYRGYPSSFFAWPEDCYVQWGGHGVVLSEKGNYQTAFFEAFPEGAGFIRGEGSNIDDAQADAFRKYTAFLACDHLWGRGKYLNGGCICKKCKSFMTRMKPVFELGSYRKLPSSHALSMAAEGEMRYTPFDDEKSRAYTRKTWLNLRFHGIDLPPIPEETSRRSLFEPDDDYARVCKLAVVTWYRENKERLQKPGSNTMSGLFSALDFRILDRLSEEI